MLSASACGNRPRYSGEKQTKLPLNGVGGLPAWNVPGGQMHWPFAGLMTTKPELTVHRGVCVLSAGNFGV